MFLLVLVHGLTAGTDSGSPAVAGLYRVSGGSVLFLTVYRALMATAGRSRQAASAGKPGR